MESLFLEELTSDSLTALNQEQDGARTSSQPKTTRKTKSFGRLMESYLENAFQEAFKEQTQHPSEPNTEPNPKKLHKPLSGLDLLIRSTIEPNAIQVQESATGKRKLTLTFDREKLEKLRDIARNKEVYLHDIIQDIVYSYIQKHDK